MVTSLYLTKVLPASMPSADLKTTVMVGPSVTMRWTAIPMATTAARMGMSQITERRARFGGSTVACGTGSRPVGSGMAALPVRARIPDQARVEGLHGKHRQHHHGHEEHHPGPGLHRHERLELDEGDGKGVDEHIEHGPPPDDLDQAVQARAVAIARHGPALHGDQEVRQRDQLPERDHDAGHEYDDGQRPRARRVEKNCATHDGVGIGRYDGVGPQHREDIGRDVANGRGDEERPRALDGIAAAPLELAAAARAVPRLHRSSLGGSRQQVARPAGDESGFRSAPHGGAHSAIAARDAASAHVTRFQTSAGSKLTMMAGRRTTSRPTAYIPIPGDTVASSAIFTSATRMPSIITSLIDQGFMTSAQRSSSPTHKGAGGRLAARSTVSMNAM